MIIILVLLMIYESRVSDNCDNNFGTFDDFGVKNDQKVSHNMILMSKYEGQHGGKRVKKFGHGSPPPFRAMPERKHFFFRRVSLTRDGLKPSSTQIYQG